MGHTTKMYAFPYPTTGDPADGPAAFLGLAQRVETVLYAEISKLNTQLRNYVGGTSGYASLRAYVDHQDSQLSAATKKAYIAADTVVTNAYIKADSAMANTINKAWLTADNDIRHDYDLILTSGCQVYNGVLIGSMAPIGVGESRDVSNVITIPGNSRRRILVIECSGYWTQGFGDIQINMDGDIRREARASDTNQSVHVTYAIELAVNVTHNFQMTVVGRGPNVSNKENNVLQLSGAWSYIQAHTILGGG